MEDDTTTTTPVEPTGADEALPVQDDAPVVADEPSTTEPSEPSQDVEAEEPSAPAVDDKLTKYAKSQGIELDSPSAIKAAGIAMKAQAEATRNYQKSSELEKGMSEMSDASAEHTAAATGQDPEVLKRLQRMEVRDTIRTFWANNPGAEQYESRINEIAQTAGLYGTPEAILKASYAMALSENSDKVKSEARKQTLTNLAHKQQAAVPAGHATTNATPKEKPFAELTLEEMAAKLGTVRQ